MQTQTKVEIDNLLLEAAMQLSQLPTKKAVVEEALQQLVVRLRRQQMLQLRGKVDWEGRRI